ncbi:L,D-transpeptidase catalytic domain [Faunimonas pinastri]|uniref:L,D-transpeptidase catalytic domain n=1 Tax=Faunimonas pinastri TaxID=1855383 RepID=A0A1H9QH34_9HYPH|nr:L,D-transpeptidase [Faunimonas pinastri]SER59861.1 L,D-transpeptidase catalytic domain [Faunimonas pinastri]
MFDRRAFLMLGATSLLGACAGVSGPLGGATSGPKILYGPKDEKFKVPPVDLSRIDSQFWRQVVDDPTGEAPGTIVIAPDQRFLFLVMEGGKARRYGVGVGREGFLWAGKATIQRKAKWPTWTPPADMIARDPRSAQFAHGMPGGPSNPLGARAMYLYQGGRDTLYRIHGTNEPYTIGHAMSSGCIRMLDADVIDLYDRVPVGTKVVVLPSKGTAIALGS